MNCRLLYLVGQLRSGGMERQLYYLVRTMDRERYRPAIAVWSYCDQDFYVKQVQAIGVPIFPLPTDGSAAEKLASFRRLTTKLRPEVIHSYSFYTNFAAYWAAFPSRAVALGSIRSGFTWAKRETGPWLGRLDALFPRHQICNSHSAAADVQQSHSPFVPRRLHIVFNGIDLQRFQKVPMDSRSPVRIAAVGNLLPVKRWDRLLQAARELQSRGVDFHIQIAGEGPLHKPLQQQIWEFGIGDCVQLLGYTENIPALLADATFLVHTADSEGCPNAVMEAMACARAVVATDVGDISSLVEDGKTGFVIPREDSGMLAQRIAELIMNPDLSRKMGEAGRIKAQREFGLDRLVTETLKAYRNASWQDE